MTDMYKKERERKEGEEGGREGERDILNIDEQLVLFIVSGNELGIKVVLVWI